MFRTGLQHFQMARMRSLETGREMIRSTNTGITAIIASDGSVRQRLPQFVTGVLTANIHSHSGITPYVNYGLLPVSLGAVLLLVFARLLRKNPLRL